MAPPPPPAGIIRRCRRRGRKTDGAPLSQPKLLATAASKIFTATCKRGQNLCTVKHQQ